FQSPLHPSHPPRRRAIGPACGYFATRESCADSCGAVINCVVVVTGLVPVTPLRRARCLPKRDGREIPREDGASRLFARPTHSLPFEIAFLGHQDLALAGMVRLADDAF